MNNRDYKNFAEGEYYHIFNRGAGKIDIFKNKEDYSAFLRRLKLVLGFKDEKPKIIKVNGSSFRERPLQIKPLPKGSFDLVSYCFMPNHFHFLIKQNGDIPITLLISKLCTSYSMYFNRKYERVGTLFQDAFKAINVSDNNYLLWLSAYIHQNPTVAGLAWDVGQWEWSSYHSFLNPDLESICEKSIILDQFKKGEYKKFVESSFDQIKKRKAEIKDIFLD